MSQFIDNVLSINHFSLFFDYKFPADLVMSVVDPDLFRIEAVLKLTVIILIKISILPLKM